jgi:hypothetical protein
MHSLNIMLRPSPDGRGSLLKKRGFLPEAAATKGSRLRRVQNGSF